MCNIFPTQPKLHENCQDFVVRFLYIKSSVRFRFVSFQLLMYVLYVYAVMTYDDVLYFADEDAWGGIAQLHVNKYAPARVGLISYDCVVVYIKHILCSFESDE